MPFIALYIEINAPIDRCFDLSGVLIYVKYQLCRKIGLDK